MFWKKKKPDKPQAAEILLGMVMLLDENPFDLKAFEVDYNSKYVNKIDEISGANASAAFTIEGEMAAVMHMPIPIPSGDIEGTAQYAYNWQTALQDTREHKGHLIVSILKGSHDQVKRSKFFIKNNEFNRCISVKSIVADAKGRLPDRS